MNYCGFHSHTTFSDGKNTMEEMVQSAIRLGMPVIGFSDHSDSPYQDYCMRVADYPAYLAELSRLKEKYADQITIMRGIELDSHSDPAIVEKVDYFLGSVHELVYEDRYYGIDHARDLQLECIARECGGDQLVFAQDYFNELVAHIQRTKPTIVGHFDVLTKFSVIDEQNPAYRRMALDALEKVVAVTPVVEINTGAISRKWREIPYPADFILRGLKEMGGKIILGADTHAADTIDCAFPLAVKIAKQAGFDTLLTLWPDGFREQRI